MSHEKRKISERLKSLWISIAKFEIKLDKYENYEAYLSIQCIIIIQLRIPFYIQKFLYLNVFNN